MASTSELSANWNTSDLENAINDILLDDAQPAAPDDEMICRSPRISKPQDQTLEDLYKAFSEDFEISSCKPAEVLSRVHGYIEERLGNRKWLALWRSCFSSSGQRFIDTFVEVDDVCGDQAHVALFAPPSLSESEPAFQIIQSHLKEMEHTVDVVELYPAVMPGYNPDLEDDEIKEMATFLENVRFFFEHIHRDWDDDDEREQDFDSCLRSRLQLHFHINNGCVPSPVVARYNRTMSKYLIRRKDLLDYQSVIQSQGEPTNSEAVECWRKYYEVLMLSGLLQIWESLQLSVEGPCFPQVLRRKKGKRPDGSTVTHLVTRVLTPGLVKKFPDDTEIMQHETPLSALKQCYEGDDIILFPGTYSGDGFHQLTESVTIKGMGDKEEVIIKASCSDDLFVNIHNSTVTIENLSFWQEDNAEAALRIDSGHAIISNCLIKSSGTGVIVHQGAQLTMQDTTVKCSSGSAVEVMPGSTVVLENNVLRSDEEEDSADEITTETAEIGKSNETGKGVVHLHVVDPPVLKMEGNTIENGVKRGVTISRKVYSGSELLGYKKENFVVDAEKAHATAVSGDGERLTGKEGILKLIFGENGAPIYSQKSSDGH